MSRISWLGSGTAKKETIDWKGHIGLYHVGLSLVAQLCTNKPLSPQPAEFCHFAATSPSVQSSFRGSYGGCEQRARSAGFGVSLQPLGSQRVQAPSILPISFDYKGKMGFGGMRWYIKII